MNLPSNKKKTTFDLIQDWYLSKEGDVVLSDTQEEIRQRWHKAWTLLGNYHSPSQAATVLMKSGIKQAQAYRDVKNAINLFGDIQKADKEGYRHILYEYSVKVFQLAAKEGNLTEMNRAINNMTKLKGLDREDPDIPDFSRLEIAPTTVSIPAEVLEFLMKNIGGGVVDVSKFVPSDTEDVEFKDVKNEES